MISIVIQDTKQFMAKLFKEDIFDKFHVSNMEIISFATFEIKKNSPSTGLGSDKICTWQMIRPYAYTIIKGKDAPRSIKIVFSLSKEEGEKLGTDTNFFMNMYFAEGELYFTTGTSTKNFTLDKKSDHIWEDYVKNFFKQNSLT